MIRPIEKSIPATKACRFVVADYRRMYQMIEPCRDLILPEINQ